MSSAALTPRRIGCIEYLERYLAGWAKDNPLIADDERLALLPTTSAILSKPECTGVVSALIASSELRDAKRGLSLAGRFGLDGRPVAKRWLVRSPVDGYLWQWLLSHTGDQALDDLLDEAYELLPIATLRSGPQDTLGLGLAYEADSALRVVIQHLRKHPNHGWPLVVTVLRNRVVGVRDGALKVLDEWPADQWPATARVELQAALEAEPCEDVRRNMQALLNDGKLPPRPSRS